jgi:hypothetical protein
MNPGDRRRSAQGRVNLWASQAAKSAHGTTTPLALDLTLPQGVGNMQYLTFLTCFRLFEAPHRRQGLVCDLLRFHSASSSFSSHARPALGRSWCVIPEAKHRRIVGVPGRCLLGGLGVVVVLS